MGAKPGQLTEKQRRFVEFYTGEAKGNGALAARLAGYQGTDKALTVAGSRLLATASVAAAIQSAFAAVRSKATLTRREVAEFLAKAVREEIEEDVVVVQGEGDGMSTATTVRKRIGARDRLKAAEVHLKVSGDMIEKVEVKSDVHLKTLLQRVGKRVFAKEFKHLTPEAWNEFLGALGQT